jgi:hypothetical protein
MTDYETLPSAGPAGAQTTTEVPTAPPWAPGRAEPTLPVEPPGSGSASPS